MVKWIWFKKGEAAVEVYESTEYLNSHIQCWLHGTSNWDDCSDIHVSRGPAYGQGNALHTHPWFTFVFLLVMQRLQWHSLPPSHSQEGGPSPEPLHAECRALESPATSAICPPLWTAWATPQESINWPFSKCPLIKQPRRQVTSGMAFLAVPPPTEYSPGKGLPQLLSAPGRDLKFSQAFKNTYFVISSILLQSLQNHSNLASFGLSLAGSCCYAN